MQYKYGIFNSKSIPCQRSKITSRLCHNNALYTFHPVLKTLVGYITYLVVFTLGNIHIQFICIQQFQFLRRLFTLSKLTYTFKELDINRMWAI